MNKNTNKNMKKAFVEQIILWIMLFICFVTFLFFVIDYSNAIKVKDNTDAIADYVARMVALGNSAADTIDGANGIKDDYFASMVESDLVCVDDTTVSNHKVIVNVYTTLTNGFLPTGNSNVHSRTVVFNEKSEIETECTLTLSFN